MKKNLVNWFSENRNLRMILGFSVSATLLWLTFYRSGLKMQNLGLKGEQWYYFIASGILFILATWIQSIRTKLIWADETVNSGSVDTYSSLMMGNFYNCLLPGSLGEMMRAWHFSKKQKLSFSNSVAGIITEKWMDSKIFVAVSIIPFLVKPLVGNYILYAIAFTSVSVLLLMAFHTIMRSCAQLEKNIWLYIISFKKAGRFLFRLYRHTNNHLDNLKKDGRRVYYFIWCMIIFFLNLLQFLLLLKAAGVPAPVCGIYSSILIALSMMIIVIIPAAPGNIGVIHYGVYSTLILASNRYGIIPDSANLQSYALFGVYVHLSYLIPEVMLGIIFLIKERKVIWK